MIFKKSFSLLIVTVFIFTSVLAQFAWAAEVSEATLLEDLLQVEIAIYGTTQEKPLIERAEYLEKELVGRTLPGTIASRAKQLKEFIISGTPEEPSVIFKINASQWMLEEKITPETLFVKIENLFIDNKLIIPANSEGVGEITKAKKATILSRPGKLEIEFKSVSALDGTSLGLILGEKAEEENKRLYVAVGAGILGLIVLSSPIGLVFGALVPGKNVKIEEGTEMFLQVKEDTTVIALVH